MKLPTLKERNDRYIRRVFKLCGGNVAATAKVLGLGRATAYREVARLGIFQRKSAEEMRAERRLHAQNARQHRALRKYRVDVEEAGLTKPVRPFWL